jgi:hypothetical protein
LGCGDDGAAFDAGRDGGDDGVVFPADFEARYLEMRDCRHSHEHELRYIRVFASESAQASYAALSPEAPYPPGATLVKIEYDDEACSTELQYTAMQKLGAGENRAGGDWLWQRVSLEREVLEEGAPVRCINCHAVHCAPPYGYDLSCAEEL